MNEFDKIRNWTRSRFPDPEYDKWFDYLDGYVRSSWFTFTGPYGKLISD